MNSRRIRKSYCAIAIAAAAMMLASCGSSTPGTPAAGEVDVRKLDVGNYSTAPLDFRFTYNPRLATGKQLALMRLADHVATGLEIDARFKYSNGLVPLADPTAAIELLADANKPVLERNGMLFGLGAGSSERTPGKDNKPPADSAFSTIVVLQFPTEGAARQAATEIENIDFSVAADRNERVPLSNYPQARSHWRPGVSTIGSTMARGHYVINLYIGQPDADVKGLAALAEKAYDAEVPLLDALKPLTLDETLRLDYDPDGMLRRTLNLEGFGTPDFQNQLILGQRGFLHETLDQNYWKRLAADVGLDRYALSANGPRNTSKVVRTRDSDAAKTLASKILEQNYPGVADSPANVPESKCGEGRSDQFEYQDKRFRCVVRYRQYVATVESAQLTDAHQRAAAQYALLANNQ
ncbi:hypothetical protein [Nocardia sp. NPDC052566]|uniref:DUF7373 family lipoprotein n=1 Tax=Nocardia sp. NPDC052566 TaxID=3364330 RepID=UPI0037C88528